MFCFFFVGCSNENKQDEMEFLQCEILDIPDMLIGSPVGILKDGCNLIVLDYKQDSFFHTIDLMNKRYVGMFGVKGQGPNEFIHPTSMKNLGNGTFSCFDGVKRELKIILPNLTDIGKSQVVKLLKNNNFMTFDIVPVSDSLFIQNGETNGAMFTLIDRKGAILSMSDEYPFKDETEKIIPARFRAMAYQGTLRVNPNNYFAYAITNAKQIHLYKVENKRIKKIGEIIDGYGYYKPDMSREGAYHVAHLGEYPKCYLDLSVTNDYVYALYSGRSFEEYKMAAYEGETIFVYDWTGKLVKMYRLNIPITKFCVDEVEKVIYATANIPDPTIVCFQLD